MTTLWPRGIGIVPRGRLTKGNEMTQTLSQVVGKERHLRKKDNEVGSALVMINSKIRNKR